jgi:hypothetical protein
VDSPRVFLFFIIKIKNYFSQIKKDVAKAAGALHTLHQQKIGFISKPSRLAIQVMALERIAKRIDFGTKL